MRDTRRQRDRVRGREIERGREIDRDDKDRDKERDREREAVHIRTYIYCIYRCTNSKGIWENENTGMKNKMRESAKVKARNLRFTRAQKSRRGRVPPGSVKSTSTKTTKSACPTSGSQLRLTSIAVYYSMDYIIKKHLMIRKYTFPTGNLKKYISKQRRKAHI